MTVEHRVVGPPGTGKTTYVARQVAVAAGKYGADGVAIASLTKAAAEEIADRVGAGVPRDRVGTLHAHAFRSLDRPRLAETPEGLADWNRAVEGHAPALRIGRSTGAMDGGVDGPSAQTDGERLLQEYNRRRARMEPPDSWPGGLRRFADRWERFKADTSRRDFADLIQDALAAATRAEGPRVARPDLAGDAFLGDLATETDRPDGMPGAPAVLFVDEAQDLSRLEFALVRAWAEHVEQLVVVGDPWQNLYEWRGSEPDAFSSTPAATETVLAQSHRVPAAVHEYAVEWARRIRSMPFPEYRPTDHAGRVDSAAATWMHPDPLIARLEAAAAAGRRVMVLAPCGYMLEPTMRLLRGRGVPFGNPYRPAHGAWNPLRGAGALLAFLRPDRAAWGDQARMWTWDDARRWLDPLRARGLLAHGAKAYVEHRSDPDQFGAEPGQVPLDKLVGLFDSEADAERAFALDVAWWQDALRASKARQHRYPVEVCRRRGPAALRDHPRAVDPGADGWPGVIVGTIHSVKGGQADDVIVFPDLSRQGYWTGWENPADRDPTVRAFYVAFTRARDRLTLCQPAGAEYAHLPRPDRTDPRPAARGDTPARRLADEIRARARKSPQDAATAGAAGVEKSAGRGDAPGVRPGGTPESPGGPAGGPAPEGRDR